jgi:hypothetical protein
MMLAMVAGEDERDAVMDALPGDGISGHETRPAPRGMGLSGSRGRAMGLIYVLVEGRPGPGVAAKV